MKNSTTDIFEGLFYLIIGFGIIMLMTTVSISLWGWLTIGIEHVIDRTPLYWSRQ